MKFEEWFEDFYGMCAGNSDTYFTSEAAWNACKKEILEILKDKNNHSHYEPTEFQTKETIDVEVVEKIEKL